MSVAEVAARLAPGPAKSAKVVTIDIERVPGRFRIENYRGSLNIEGDFWDLSQWKHTIGRRIHPDEVTEWPRTICLAWKWYGKKTQFAAEWQEGGNEAMLRAIWDVYDQAELIYGHNIDNFDTKHLNTGWRDLGMWSPSPFKTLDTLKEARKTFGDESKTLLALTQRLGITTKNGHYSVAVARAACAGDRKAQREMKTYNMGDPEASEAFVDRLRGWIPSHPHALMGTMNDRPTCNQCWGDNLERNGTKLAQQITYVLYRCTDCGANVQGTRHSRAAVTRGAR